jgi:hypothetical protein
MPSGQPQIADYLLIITSIVVFLLSGIRMKAHLAGVIQPLVLLVAYMFIVNILVSITNAGVSHGGLSPIFINLYYLYNFLAILLGFILYSKYKDEFLRTTLGAVFISAVMVISLAPFFQNSYYSTIRLTLTFNNPNQTGYYALSALTLFLVAGRAIKVSWLWTLAMTIMVLYITAVSLSKAAIYSVVILYVLSFIEGFISNPKRLLFTIFIIFIVVISVLFTDQGSRFINNYQYRGTVHDERLNEFHNRGYDRILNHPEYTILGAGEGYYNRFESYIGTHEMHSSYGTLLFSYGIPGLFLFFLFVYRSVRHVRWNDALFIVPILAYGFTHMGLRFTLFWISMSLFGILGSRRTKPRSHKPVMPQAI